MNDGGKEAERTALCPAEAAESAENGDAAGAVPACGGSAGSCELGDVIAGPEEKAAVKESPEPPEAVVSEGEPDEARIAELLANPMFIHFARGRSGGIDLICREFEAMLAAGGLRGTARMSAPVAAKIVPAAASASPEVALSERQRGIARAAGMSYREYYELVSEIPGSIHQKS